MDTRKGFLVLGVRRKRAAGRISLVLFGALQRLLKGTCPQDLKFKKLCQDVLGIYRDEKSS